MKKRISKSFLLIVSLVFLLALSVAVSLAYIYATDQPAVNIFEPATVSCQVNESFDGNLKSNVTVQNTGNVSAYVRAFYTVTWLAETDSAKILATQPQVNVDYSVVWGSDLWIQGADGYWYYPKAIAPEEVTENLIDSIQALGAAPEGYRLQVEIFASAIQSQPVDVVQNQWGVATNNGILVP